MEGGEGSSFSFSYQGLGLWVGLPLVLSKVLSLGGLGTVLRRRRRRRRGKRRRRYFRIRAGRAAKSDYGCPDDRLPYRWTIDSTASLLLS